MPLRFPGDERAYIENWLKWLNYWRNQGAPPPTSGPTTVIYTAPTEPDTIGKALAFLVSSANTKVAAANMSNKELAKQVVAAADNGILQFLDSDDICPPWPYPGPPIPLVDLASELTLVANTIQDGSLRAALLSVAGQVLDRAYALTSQATVA
jgi:hypothetical protein